MEEGHVTLWNKIRNQSRFNFAKKKKGPTIEQGIGEDLTCNAYMMKVFKVGMG